ncbi:MAG TPA: hypothetical protein VFR91_00730 [Dyella sp.]|nr:hypothetical protein [Dyella sp.]
MELGFAGLTISLASVIAVWFGAQLIQMTETLDALSVATGPQTEAIVYRAVHGRWPSPGDARVVSSVNSGTYAQHLSLEEGGVITADMRLGHTTWSATGVGLRVRGGSRGLLSFRPELLGSTDVPSVSYLCGYARPTAGAVEVAAANRTTLPRNHLPPYCR